MYFYELSAHNRSIYCIIQIYVPYVCVCVSVGAESEKPVGEAVELPTHLS